MKTMTLAVRRALAATACVLPLAALATDGYFSHGYGMKGKGMGGAGVSLAQDAFAGANNPAASAFAGTRLDLGLDWFSPKRKASRSGSGGGVLDFSVDSDSTNFFIPEFGYNARYSDQIYYGISVYGNGGMNTDYPGGQLNCSPFGGPPSANGLCGQGKLGVDLSQLLVAPTIAWKINADHALGIAPLFAYQRFKMDGAQLFTQLSQAPAYVTNVGYDSSTGWGARVGYMGKVAAGVALGASYTSKMNMGKFDKYKGLFAEDGGFDIPAHMSAGVSFEPAKAWQLAVEWERILYNDVKSVGNPSTNQAPLGSSNGPGFGWQDVDVWKIGVQWQQSPQLTLRAGYNHSDNPVRPQDVTFNILAPGVVKDQWSAGASFKVNKTSEITGSFMYAQHNTVTGPSLFVGFGAPPTTTETIGMKEYLIGVAYSHWW
jgi:long-chain fatty acid transport protein